MGFLFRTGSRPSPAAFPTPGQLRRARVSGTTSAPTPTSPPSGIDGVTPIAVANVPRSRAIPAAEMVTGSRVDLDAGPPFDPDELVVIAVFT